MPDRACAEVCFKTAIRVVRSRDGRLLELRAATDLAHLWRDTRSGHEAHALLQPILGAMEDGEAAPDLRTARSLLEELA